MKLQPGALQSQAYVFNAWAIRPKHGETLKQVQDPTYWVNVANMLKTGDTITAYWEDDSLYAELLVTGVKPLSVETALIRKVEINNKNAEKNADKNKDTEYSVKWVAGKSFCIVRNSDKETIKEGLPNKDEALKWIENL